MTTPVQQVAIHGASINTWILALLALINALGVGGALTWWIKSRGGWKKNDDDAETQIRREMWADIAALKESKEKQAVRLENQSRRITLAETALSQQASEIGQLRFLIALAAAELERVAPDNPVARQIRLVMDQLEAAASHTAHTNSEETGIMAEIMTKMCIIKGSNE